MIMNWLKLTQQLCMGPRTQSMSFLGHSMQWRWELERAADVEPKYNLTVRLCGLS